ncbi:MAG: hypothetical protein AAGA72_05300 [Pseudomonadota bacterium]
MTCPSSDQVSETFANASAPGGLARPSQRRERKHPPPFSIRFTDEERAILKRDAGGLSWSAYIRSKLFADEPTLSQRLTRKRSSPDVDHALLAQVLGELGRSRLASNLNQIAKAANIGTLPVTPELELELKDACAAVKDMRATLITALGIKVR